MARILVVDDDIRMAEVLHALLALADHDVHIVGDGRSAIRHAKESSPDVVILDLELPDMAGEDVLSALRGDVATVNTPVLVLTGARTSATEELTGLQLGADDYIRKGTPLPILRQRLETVLRRAHPGAAATTTKVVGRMRIDAMAGEVELNGLRLNVTGKPLRLLWYLASNAHRPVARRELLEQLWPADLYDHALDQAVHSLRKALREPGVIETVAGYGYKLGRRVSGD